MHFKYSIVSYMLDYVTIVSSKKRGTNAMELSSLRSCQSVRKSNRVDDLTILESGEKAFCLLTVSDDSGMVAHTAL